MTLRPLLALLVPTLASCASFNPYERVHASPIEFGNGTVNCWVHASDERCPKGCDDRVAQPDLDDCVKQLSVSIPIRTSETIARRNLIECMETKGWERRWVSGDMHVE